MKHRKKNWVKREKRFGYQKTQCTKCGRELTMRKGRKPKCPLCDGGMRIKHNSIRDVERSYTYKVEPPTPPVTPTEKIESEKVIEPPLT